VGWLIAVFLRNPGGAGCVNCACPVLTGGWRGDSPPYRTQ
jgi:hypothetical protein